MRRTSERLGAMDEPEEKQKIDSNMIDEKKCKSGERDYEEEEFNDHIKLNKKEKARFELVESLKKIEDKEMKNMEGESSKNEDQSESDKRIRKDIMNVQVESENDKDQLDNDDEVDFELEKDSENKKIS